jgi:hypothetical protein
MSSGAAPVVVKVLICRFGGVKPPDADERRLPELLK